MTRSAATTRSTAGLGFAFEDLVAADLLSRFLLDMPIYGIGVPGAQLFSQAAAAGWLIDDLICVGLASNGIEHRLALSCKSNVQVSDSGWPAEFISMAWTLWRTEKPFRRSTDRMGLVTRGRNTRFDATWSDLKLWCDNADPALAISRINASKKHRQLFHSIRAPGEHAGELPSEVDTVALIAKLELYPVDFQLTPSNTLDEAKHRCRMALSSEIIAEADELWAALLKSAETARLGNGINRLSDLIRELSSRFALKAHPSISSSWNRLLALSADQRATIETSLPNGHVVSRPDESADLSKALEGRGGCIVAGDSGAGKSALTSEVLDQRFSEATQIWLGPEVLSTVLSEAARGTLGLDHDLGFLLERSPGNNKLLVLDSSERLDATSRTRLDSLLRNLADNPTWRVILISQLGGFENQLLGIRAAIQWPTVIVPTLATSTIRNALKTVPSLVWISSELQILPLLANLRTLGWVIAATSSFPQADGASLTSTAAIADRLWSHWTIGPAKTQVQRLLMRLAMREAAFERSFAISDLDSGEASAFDQRPQELPLIVNKRNRIEFRHDLASDWARYQRLKEIAHDVPQWSAWAPQPLWIAALRLFGQHLLEQPDQARYGWDHAFQVVSAAKNVEAGDLLLDALCQSPDLDRHLAARADLMFADNGLVLLRLFHRFLHIATVPNLPDHLAIGDALRIYLEADMRLPIFTRWGPLGRFLRSHGERISALGAPIVARLCKAWLNSPKTIRDRPTPLRDVMAKLALDTARARQIKNITHPLYGGEEEDKLIYATALAGAADLNADVSAFALEMARRQPLAEAVQIKVDALRAAHRAQSIARAGKLHERRQSFPPVVRSDFEDLPPWPLGPAGRLAIAFREAVLHGNALGPLMQTNPAVASEVLLACMIDDKPTRDHRNSSRLDADLGLKFDQQSYPTAFWKSPFLIYFQAQSEAALSTLKQLLDFVMERSASSLPQGGSIPTIVVMSNDQARRFPGSHWHFGWSQSNSSSNGQLFSALDALEYWLIAKAKAGENLITLCDRLLEVEGSTAILGVLINLGKYQPSLFKGPLFSLVGIEALYEWDRERISNGRFGFDAMTWSRHAEPIFNTARDWVLAPHRTIELRKIIGDLAAADPEFAASMMPMIATWSVPDDPKQRLEQRILQSELDPANRRLVPDAASGKIVTQLVYPSDLQADIFAYEAQIRPELEPHTLPYQCHKILSGTANLADADAQYLANLLPSLGMPLPDGGEQLRMVAAAAATLIARGGDWYKQRTDIAHRAEYALRTIITLLDTKSAGRDDYAANDTLSFAGIGVFHAALDADKRGEWNSPLMIILTGQNFAAITTIMRIAKQQRARLGYAWYRLNFLMILAAGLNRLSLRFDSVDGRTMEWKRWQARLRTKQIFDTEASIEALNPIAVARRVERLLERRRQRVDLDRPYEGTSKAPRLAGLSTHILECGYAWLLDHETAEIAADDAENQILIANLWAFEASRMAGERDDDESFEDNEYDLPSKMGYSILRIAPTFVLAEPADDREPLWRAIFAIGPNGHYAIDQFIAGWFLLLYKQPDPDRFIAIWKAMLANALASNWTSSRRWYRGRSTLIKLLGLNAHAELSQATAVCARIPELMDYYRQWAQAEMQDDEEAISALCYFLTTEAGRALRLEGIIWVGEALKKTESFYRDGTGNSIAEAMDAILTHHAGELIARHESRNAMIDVVAKLVGAQIPTAMGLQQRIAALR